MAKEKVTPPAGDTKDKAPDPAPVNPETQNQPASDPSKSNNDETARLEAEKAAADKVAAEKEAKENALFAEIARRYAEHYPACKAFHITTDRQVFLNADKAEAEAHQREIGGGKVRTINVD